MTVKVNSNRILEAMKKRLDMSAVIVVDQVASHMYEVLLDLGLGREARELREYWKKQWSEK